jgi:hypothetical protein
MQHVCKVDPQIGEEAKKRARFDGVPFLHHEPKYGVQKSGGPTQPFAVFVGVPAQPASSTPTAVAAATYSTARLIQLRHFIGFETL